MTHGMTKLTGLVLAAGLGFGLLATAGSEAQAGHRSFSFYGGPGGFSFSVGPRYGYGYGYRPYRRYYNPYYYAPAPRRYYRKKRYGRCHYKARKCAQQWGWHNRNWRGCMRYYRCR